MSGADRLPWIAVVVLVVVGIVALPSFGWLLIVLAAGIALVAMARPGRGRLTRGPSPVRRLRHRTPGYGVAMATQERETPRICPACGEGELVDLAFDERAGRPRQTAESREVDVYSCGHEVPGPSLATADADELEVERRSSDEGVVPPDEPAG